MKSWQNEDKTFLLAIANYEGKNKVIPKLFLALLEIGLEAMYLVHIENFINGLVETEGEDASC